MIVVDFLFGILKRVHQEYPDFAADLFVKSTIVDTSNKKNWQFWKK
jgi:hypothetical protein